jgi:hypothetical protein
LKATYGGMGAVIKLHALEFSKIGTQTDATSGKVARIFGPKWDELHKFTLHQILW